MRSGGGPQEEGGMSEQMSDRTDRDDVQQDVAAAGSTDEAAGNLTVEDDPQGTTDPADLAGTGGSQDDGVD